jgi:hypothetical protein
VRIRKVAVYCGARWYRLSDWKLYLGEFGFVRVLKDKGFKGFSIGPILFWDGK